MVNLLQASDLVFDYAGPLRAVDRLSLEVRAGELLAVIGPNGSGKSTLLKLLCGLLQPASGRVVLEGRPLTDYAPRERARRIAIVPQALEALPEVRVRDFVLGGRYAHVGRFGVGGAHDTEVVDAALAACDATEYSERLLTQISGGQRQRVMIARAVVQEAAVLLVDEPTNALDPEHQLAIFDLLASLRRAGRAVVVVTHDLNLASQFATSLALVSGGRIVARGSAQEVLRREVLEPIYGERLRYGTWPGPAGEGERPFVIPWVE